MEKIGLVSTGLKKRLGKNRVCWEGRWGSGWCWCGKQDQDTFLYVFFFKTENPHVCAIGVGSVARGDWWWERT